MKILLLILLILPVSLVTYSQDWVWGIKAYGNQQTSGDMDIAVDHQGNVVLAGYYQLKLKLGNDSLYTEDDYYSDIFLCRMDSAHHIQWLKHIEALDNYDSGIGVTVDDDKNIYLTAGIDYYVFVSKYDSLGNLLWTCDFDHELYGAGYDITTDIFDNVYVTGQDGGSIFITKLNYDGKVLWTKVFDTLVSDGSRGSDIAVDAAGSVYVAGTFDISTYQMDSIPLTHVPRWGPQPFVTKLSEDGKMQWVISPRGISSEWPQLALHSNGFYLASEIVTETMDFGGIVLHKIPVNNTYSPFIASYDTSGHILQAQISGDYYDGKGNPTDMVTDLQDNIYLTRTGSGIYGTSTGSFRIEKYNSSLELQWEKVDKTRQGGYALGLGVDPSGAAYIIGRSEKKDFITPSDQEIFFSLGAAKINTPSPIPLKPDRPRASRLKIFCEGEQPGELSAQGANIKWYSDPSQQQLLHEGNPFKPLYHPTDTFYVTQTIAGIESPPKEIIRHLSEINEATLTLRNDTLFASTGPFYRYQWLSDGRQLEHWRIYGGHYFQRFDTLSYIVPREMGNYRVKITEGDCQKEIGIAFIPKRVANNLQDNSYSVFPNPTRGPVNVVVKTDTTGPLKVRLMDMNGKLMDEVTDNTYNGYFIASFNVRDLPSGNYLIRLSGQNVERTLKLVRK